MLVFQEASSGHLGLDKTINLTGISKMNSLVRILDVGSSSYLKKIYILYFKIWNLPKESRYIDA